MRQATSWVRDGPVLPWESDAATPGQLAFVDAGHRVHAGVQDRIRTGKDTGLGRFPSRSFAINAARLITVMLAVDLLSWAQAILLRDVPVGCAACSETAGWF